MMLRKAVTVLLLAFGLAAASVHANEAEIRKAMQARFPGVPVESVTKTPFPGIFEVVVGGVRDLGTAAVGREDVGVPVHLAQVL